VAPRSYQLLIEVGRPVSIRVGRLGTFRFPAGRYVYTGSARRTLEARIARHLGARRRLHWHIDFLLAAPGARVLRVRRSRLPECALNQRTPGAMPVAGFGATDCRAGCGSHLKHRGPRARGRLDPPGGAW
jgi:Uri superfamily endonuclease